MDKMLHEAITDGCRDFARESETELSRMRSRLETALCQAFWTLRRLPDRELGWIYGSDRAKWPEVRKDYHRDHNPPPPKGATLQPTNGRDMDYATQVLVKIRPTAAEISAMQPALDMLQLLPDNADKKLVSAVLWHWQGEPGGYIYWAEIRPWLRGRLVTAHRRTLMRHYERSLDWLAQLVLISK